MIHHQIDEHAYAALLASMRELDKIAQSAVAEIDAVVIGDVVAVIAQWRWLERHQPDRGHAQSMEIIQSPHQSGEVADTVSVGVHETTNRQAVNDRVFI